MSTRRPLTVTHRVVALGALLLIAAFPSRAVRAGFAPARTPATADELLALLATHEPPQAQMAIDELRFIPPIAFDDATLRQLVARLADVADLDLSRPFHDCGTGEEDWPRAEWSAVAAALLRVGAQVPDALLVASCHRQAEARLRAIDALDALPSSATRDRFIEMLSDPEPRVRASAAAALDRLQPCGHQQQLLPLLRDPSKDVRGSVAVLLATCGSRDAMAVLAEVCDGEWGLIRPPPLRGSLEFEEGPACAELAGLVTHDLARTWTSAHLSEALAAASAQSSSDGGLRNLDIGPGFAWKGWWQEHGSEVDMLERNVALAVERATDVSTASDSSTDRCLSVALLERACDEQHLRTLAAAKVDAQRFSQVTRESMEHIRARLAPGRLAATALRSDELVHVRGFALRRLFAVDRLRARALQLILLDGPQLSDLAVALRLAESYPLPPRSVHERAMTWARSDPAGTRRVMLLEIGGSDCELTCLLAQGDPNLSRNCDCGAPAARP